MIVKGKKQLGSFKRGINLYVPRKSSSGGGITSSTSIIAVNDISLQKRDLGSNNFAGGERIAGNFWVDEAGTTLLASPDFEYVGPFGFGNLGFTWVYVLNSSAQPMVITSSNPSTNLSFIPVTNWSPSISIGTTVLVSNIFAFTINGVTAQNTSQIISNGINGSPGLTNHLISSISNLEAVCAGSSTPPYSAPYNGNLFGNFIGGSESSLSYLNGTWTLHFKFTEDAAPPITYSIIDKTVTTNDPTRIPLDFGEGITLTSITNPTYFRYYCG